VSKPSAPDRPDVTEVHVTSCTVTYQPPQRDGGAPVTGYVLERRTPSEPDGDWVKVNETPVTDLQFTVDSLTPAMWYTFRVAAVNCKGMSNFSPESDEIETVEKPGKPGRPEVIKVHDRSCIVKYEPPQLDGGTPMKYILERREPWGSRKWMRCSKTEVTGLQFIIDDLIPGTGYEFRVAATNVKGMSEFSPVSQVITTLAAKDQVIVSLIFLL